MGATTYARIKGGTERSALGPQCAGSDQAAAARAAAAPVGSRVENGRPSRRQRARVVPYAKGRVLEIGIGTGRNFHFYDPTKVERVIGLDPAEGMLALARKRARLLRIAGNNYWGAAVPS